MPWSSRTGTSFLWVAELAGQDGEDLIGACFPLSVDGFPFIVLPL